MMGGIAAITALISLSVVYRESEKRIELCAKV